MVRQGTLYLTLFVATFAVSWAAILIKLAGAGPLPTAFYRMALSSIILAIPAYPKARATLRILTRRQLALLVFSGFMLGLHFASWITSLFYTSISNSVILVSTNPAFVLISEAVILKEKIPVRSVVGMIVALAGIIIISGGDFSLGREYIIGDVLAIFGAVCVALYLIAGRQLRAGMDNLSYTFPVYSLAALTILVFTIADGESLVDYPARTWLFFLLLALIPTLMGHSLYNWLLKYTSAHLVATTVLGEPVGATILAIIFFDQIPGWTTILGGILILSGIFIVLRKSSGIKSNIS
ncbi:MAG: DMT family transporter [Candidatus Zixiibacteriota bacterium]|nr:MAG: DMT family transporter [candidate division Zixibacteria bacterium]